MLPYRFWSSKRFQNSKTEKPFALQLVGESVVSKRCKYKGFLLSSTKSKAPCKFQAWCADVVSPLSVGSWWVPRHPLARAFPESYNIEMNKKKMRCWRWFYFYALFATEGYGQASRGHKPKCAHQCCRCNVQVCECVSMHEPAARIYVQRYMYIRGLPPLPLVWVCILHLGCKTSLPKALGSACKRCHLTENIQDSIDTIGKDWKRG